MSNPLFLTKKVYDAFVALASSERTNVFPSDIVQYFRDRNEPVGIWLVTRELTLLEERELICFDHEAATWSLGKRTDFFEAFRQKN